LGSVMLLESEDVHITVTYPGLKDGHIWIYPQRGCRPYNLYCVGGDVKPCSVSQSVGMDGVIEVWQV